MITQHRNARSMFHLNTICKYIKSNDSINNKVMNLKFILLVNVAQWKILVLDFSIPTQSWNSISEHISVRFLKKSLIGGKWRLSIQELSSSSDMQLTSTIMDTQCTSLNLQFVCVLRNIFQMMVKSINWRKHLIYCY